MRTVFSSNSEVCHIWAQQTQERGRAGTIFFEGDTIYSYGYHYPMARIFVVNGKRFALTDSRRSSVTTEGKHKNAVRDALHGLMQFFPSPDVSKPKEAVKYLDAEAQATIGRALKRIKVKDKSDITWEFQCISDAFEEANKLRTILGMAKKFAKPAQIAAVRAHLEKRLARYHELNTPKAIEKREREAAKRKERADATLMQKAADVLTRWRAGEAIYVNFPLPYEALRIQGDEVVTSRGARVPLDAAMTLYRAVKSGRDVKGIQLGSYTVIGVTSHANETDKIVQIGCHRILLSEAAALFDLKEAA